jgi:glycosyltransferase involved in cell wall biosynthesis
MSEISGSSPRERSLSDAPDAIAAIAARAEIRRIHLLAWRDLDDGDAGGSEVHASTVAAHWAEAGLEITMRTSAAPSFPARSTRDGYAVVRRGGRYDVFPRAILSELAGRHGPRDGLVEIWNGVPFLSPLWARGPRVTWIHHVHEDMWPMVLPAPLARIGQLMERRVAPPFYRRTPIVTLSESSKDHIVNRMNLPADNIHVVSPGIANTFVPGVRALTPSVLAVGRLMPPKAFPRLIAAMARVRLAVPAATLTIVGEGPERATLETVIADADAHSWCTLAGRVSDTELLKLYQQAWVVASASTAEGWGMSITEAAACATPAVATRIPGHRDAIVDARTGYLIDTDDDMDRALVQLLNDHDLRARFGQAALEQSHAYSWARTARRTLEVLAGTRRKPGAVSQETDTP